MVLNEHTRCQLSYCRLDITGESLHGKQQLVLLRLNAVCFCGGFAEVKKFADLLAEFGKVLILF